IIVTNRHVVQGWNKCSFNLISRAADGSPDLDNHIPIEISPFENAYIPHPNVDLAIIPLAPILSDLAKKNPLPFFIGLDPSLIPTEEELKELTPLEQILTVGFPGRIWDEVHNLPVFHMGYTATPSYVDFKGNKE